MAIEDLTGRVFTRWTVLYCAGQHPAGGSLWWCRCECGCERAVPRGYLTRTRKPSRSCGCLAIDVCPTAGLVHGQSGTRLYVTYYAMLQRCLNPKSTSYRYYGGRGIEIAECWRGEDGFLNFSRDMGAPPENQSLERKDVNGPYSPANCKWATRKTQQNNRRNNRLLTYQGQTKTVQQWCDELGLKHPTVQKRLRLGWAVEKILSTAPHVPIGVIQCEFCHGEFKPKRKSRRFCCGRCRNLARNVSAG